MLFDNKPPTFRWDCEKQGCYHKKKCPKFEVFSDCFPGRISPSDLDGIIEIKRNLLILEWKTVPEIPKGQQIMFEQITTVCPALVWVVEGNAETMDVYNVREVRGGRTTSVMNADLQGIRQAMKKWSDWASFTPFNAPLNYQTPFFLLPKEYGNG